MGNKDLPPREHLLVFNQTIPMTALWWRHSIYRIYQVEHPCKCWGSAPPTEGFEYLLKGPAQSIRAVTSHPWCLQAPENKAEKGCFFCVSNTWPPHR